MTTEPNYTDAQIEAMVATLERNLTWEYQQTDDAMNDAADMLRSLLSERQAAMQGQGGEAIIGLLRVLCPEGEKFHSDNPNNPTVLDIRKLADKLEALQPPQPVREIFEGTADALQVVHPAEGQTNMSCSHGNSIGACDLCDEIDTAYAAGLASCKPVVIPVYVNADDANRLYGDGFGTDWIYENGSQQFVRSVSDETRMDWLVTHDVEVRDPILHGSIHLFTAQTTSDEEDEIYQTSLREQIDAAIQGERHER